MVRLSDILHRLRDIQVRTLKNPTHVLIPENVVDDLVSQYGELAHSNADSVYEFEDQHFTILDVGDLLGLKIITTIEHLDDFKVLEEVTLDS